jgi:hypothetical protein
VGHYTKLPKVNNDPIGENSPNLVTLAKLCCWATTVVRIETRPAWPPSRLHDNPKVVGSSPLNLNLRSAHLQLCASVILCEFFWSMLSVMTKDTNNGIVWTVGGTASVICCAVIFSRRCLCNSRSLDWLLHSYEGTLMCTCKSTYYKSTRRGPSSRLKHAQK